MVFIHLYMCFFKDDVKSQGHVSRWPNLGEVKSTFRRPKIAVFFGSQRCQILPDSEKKPTKRFTAPVGTGPVRRVRTSGKYFWVKK